MGKVLNCHCQYDFQAEIDFNEELYHEEHRQREILLEEFLEQQYEIDFNCDLELRIAEELRDLAAHQEAEIRLQQEDFENEAFNALIANFYFEQLLDRAMSSLRRIN